MSVGAFGKLPYVGDFVRYNVVASSAIEFEHLVQRGIDVAAERGAVWHEEFDTGAMFGFLFAPRPSEGELLSGVVLPSHDSVGRRYPFVVFSTVANQAIASLPHLAPLALGEFLAGAADAAYDALDATGSVESLLVGLRPASVETLNQHQLDYEQWTHSTHAAAAFGGTFGGRYLDDTPHAVETILQCVQPWRGVEYPDTPLAVRLPIGAAGVSSVVFWVDVVRHAAGWRQTIPSLFWHWDGEYGEMLLQLGTTPAASVIELWAPHEDSEHICDLVSPGTSSVAAVLDRLPPGLAAVLQSPEARVVDLLAALAG